MDRRPTIIDVASRAGVSKSTVSLVLHNSPLVKSETREDLRRAKADLGYVFNRTSAQVVAAMLEHGVSALILSPAYGEVEATFEASARANVPTMQVLRRAVPDYRAGSRLATDHLLAGGARRIAFLGGLAGREMTEQRMAGYVAALAAAGMEPLHLPGRPGRAFGREAALRLAAEHPAVDAVLCFNDLVALGILSGCAKIGQQVGCDLKVVGFDDTKECAQVWPGLTSVRCDLAGFGRGVAETVLGWLETGTRPAPKTVTPVDLIIRASSMGLHA